MLYSLRCKGNLYHKNIYKQSSLLDGYKLRSYSSKLSKKKAVILTDTVEGIGEKGEELIVKNGYARNFLFPKNYAVLSTKETKLEYKEFFEKIDFDKRIREKELAIQRKKMSKVKIIMKREPRKGSLEIKNPITVENLSEKFWIQYQIEIEPEKIEIVKPFTKFGDYVININFGEDNVIPINVEVVRR